MRPERRLELELEPELATGPAPGLALDMEQDLDPMRGATPGASGCSSNDRADETDTQ